MRRKGIGTVSGELLPAVVLAGILAFCLWNGHTVGRQAERWERQLDAASELAAREAWPEVSDRLRESYRDWRAARSFLQMVSRHSTEEEAEELYRRALVLAEERSPEELLLELAALRARIETIAEMERLTWGNLL